MLCYMPKQSKNVYYEIERNRQDHPRSRCHSAAATWICRFTYPRVSYIPYSKYHRIRFRGLKFGHAH